MTASNHDALWLAILQEAELAVRDEPLLASFLHMTVLRHGTLEGRAGVSPVQQAGQPGNGRPRTDGAVPRGLCGQPCHYPGGACRHYRLL